MSVAETPVLNQKLEVGAQTEQVTVESTAETIQTQNATNGGVVGAQEITELPLVSETIRRSSICPRCGEQRLQRRRSGQRDGRRCREWCEAEPEQLFDDGSSIINYVSGTAGQTGSYPGIVIPNPDSIQEFKVQTSQYDASSGRNPGANVEVVTRTGQNQFHGAAWEFNRNNFFNSNDFFYKASELGPGGTGVNTPQTLKQNTFGATLGGPILKDKLFFFGSYQGIRQINGIGTSGFASGYESNVELLPWNDNADFASGVCSDVRCTNNIPAYKAYLANAFAGQSGFFSFAGGTGRPILPCAIGDATCNSTNITNTSVAILQARGIVKGGFNQGFYVPSAPASCPAGCLQAISDPTVANEDQYLINTQYVISNKNTLEERYIYQNDPQQQSFTCFITAGNCNPGAPEDVTYTNHVGQLKLVSLLTSNFVNEARFSFQRNIENGQDPNIVKSCDLPNGATIIPLENNGQPCPLANNSFSEFGVVPILDILGVGGVPWQPGRKLFRDLDQLHQYLSVRRSDLVEPRQACDSRRFRGRAHSI